MNPERIDVHAHLVPRVLPNVAGHTGDDRWPVLEINGDIGRILAEGKVFRVVDDRYWSVRRRIEELDANGIDVQVLSPLPVLLPYWADAALAAEWCRAVNDGIAEAIVDGGGRFAGLGILPLQDADLAAEELDRCRGLGLVGVELGTAVDDERMLGDPSVDAFFAHVAAEGVPVLVHPVRRGLLGPVTSQVDAGVVLTADTTMAMLPRLWPPDEGRSPMPRMCVVHGGGTLPWAWPRLSSIAASGRPLLPSWFHVDTAGVDRRQVDYLVDMLGADAILFGTDSPAVTDATVRSQLGELRSSPKAIFGANASRFLAGVPARGTGGC